MSGEDWDARYAGSERVWSGQPNAALVTESAGLTPGRALDVGCGEGADAIWLAGQGWTVTALDVSGVALDRGRVAARSAGADVRWLHSGLLEADLTPESFDLVSAQYPALWRTPDHEAEDALLGAVAPGGHLLVVHHVMTDTAVARARERGFDPLAYVSPGDVAARLGDGWDVRFDASRPRSVTGGAGAHHHDDVVLHAVRIAP